MTLDELDMKIAEYTQAIMQRDQQTSELRRARERLAAERFKLKRKMEKDDA